VKIPVLIVRAVLLPVLLPGKYGQWTKQKRGDVRVVRRKKQERRRKVAVDSW
jgi:hypothetical protein